MTRTKSPTPTSVIKRDGSIVPFDTGKIARAIEKALVATGEGSLEHAATITKLVVAAIIVKQNVAPTVEHVQDIVEAELMGGGFPATAKAYILYREHHAQLRKEDGRVSPEIRALVTESKQYFSNQLSEFVYYSTYSRWDDGK